MSKQGFFPFVAQDRSLRRLGSADIYDASGQKKACKFLCVTFPYSNAGYTQLFGGETAECAVHGLRDIFHRIGGVPGCFIFDNASGVGRRVNEHVQMADLFLRFKAHYGAQFLRVAASLACNVI
ncbi:hypothetical protein [Cohnella sp.]|uniref:hypothetical protein n=1 Tax=Cohnella sp. TaxID=1883426 RepID=UPI0035670DC6